MKGLEKKIKKALSYFSFPVYCFYKLLTASLRYTEKGRERLDELHAQGEHFVFCLWHDELFPLMKMQKHFDILTVVSPSLDGSLLANVLQKLGLRIVRGSSTRKGMSALLNALKTMRSEHVHACITLDGPLGPRHEVKDGASFVAFHANAHIVPIRIHMKNFYAFNTWDKFKLPLPFSRVTVEYADPYKINSEVLDAESIDKEKRKLKKILDEMVYVYKK